MQTLNILLKGQGSLATNTGALKVLLSSEKALADIETLAFDKASNSCFSRRRFKRRC